VVIVLITYVETDVSIVVCRELTVLSTYDLELGRLLLVAANVAVVRLDPGSGGVPSLVVAAQVLLLAVTFFGMRDRPEWSCDCIGLVSHDRHVEVGVDW